MLGLSLPSIIGESAFRRRDSENALRSLVAEALAAPRKIIASCASATIWLCQSCETDHFMPAASGFGAAACLVCWLADFQPMAPLVDLAADLPRNSRTS